MRRKPEIKLAFWRVNIYLVLLWKHLWQIDWNCIKIIEPRLRSYNIPLLPLATLLITVDDLRNRYIEALAERKKNKNAHTDILINLNLKSP